MYFLLYSKALSLLGVALLLPGQAIHVKGHLYFMNKTGACDYVSPSQGQWFYGGL